MRPIDFMNMSHRARMLNALSGGGLGRLGLVERLGAEGNIITATRMAPALEPVSPAALVFAVEPAPVDAVQLLVATPSSGAREDTGPSAYTRPENQVLARRGNVSPTPVVQSEVPTQVVNQNGPVDDRAKPEFAKGSDYNPFADEVPSQSPDVPHSTLPHAPASTTSKVVVGPSTAGPSTAGAPFPWGKALGVVAALGLGYMLWKGK